ncbi:hypothetical protein BC828DRAFT_348096, partial [Blastocladiella britannica]
MRTTTSSTPLCRWSADLGPSTNEPTPLSNNDDEPAVCGQVFASFADLLDHVKVSHIGRGSKNTRIHCHWIVAAGEVTAAGVQACAAPCGAARHKRDHLVSHLNSHLDARPHVCRRCGAQFKRKQNVVQHEQ